MANRVLIVDDAPMVRSIIKRSLTKADYDVVGEAGDGLEAVELFNQLKPDFVILDLTLPGLHGLEVLEKIRETDAEVKILVVSSLDQDALESDLFQSGASGFLWKPFDTGSIVKSLQRISNQNPEMKRKGLSEEELSNLKEVGNIGAGQAASSLSALIQRTCLLDVPISTICDATELQSQFDFQGSVVASIGVQITGDIPAVMLVVVNKQAVKRILGYMAGPDHSDEQDLPFAAQATLHKLGAAMTMSFSDSIHHFLDTKGQSSSPEILINDWTKTVDKAMKWVGQSKEKNAVIYSRFFDREKTFEGWCIYVLKKASVDTLLQRAQSLLEP